jgi:hypothetical protein
MPQLPTPMAIFFSRTLCPGRYQFFFTRAGFVNQQYRAKGNDDGAVLSVKPGQSGTTNDRETPSRVDSRCDFTRFWPS